MLEKEKCTGCMACKNICPRNAIEFSKKEGNFIYPSIKKEYCSNCGLCKKVCPIINGNEKNEYLDKAYACMNKDTNIRLKSSSGGTFSLISEYIIKNGGIVFGVELNEKLEVKHSYTSDLEEIGKFRGSKYVQSNIGMTYKKVKEFLDLNKKVLFTGTPCQVEGLISYLRKDYDNLYTQDIICHGVPAPELLEKYIEYKEKSSSDYVSNINFRDKEKLGWSKYQLLFKYNKKDEYISHNEDPYMQLFLRDIALRESCYNCNFKKGNRISDITLADFWGINNVFPEMNDEKGISAVIVNTKKGMEVFENIKENLIYKETSKDEIKKYNPSYIKPAKKFEKREEFFDDLRKNDFEFVIEKYLKK